MARRWAKAFGCIVGEVSHTSGDSRFSVRWCDRVYTILVSEVRPPRISDVTGSTIYIAGDGAARVSALRDYADWLERITGVIEPTRVTAFFRMQPVTSCGPQPGRNVPSSTPMMPIQTIDPTARSGRSKKAPGACKSGGSSLR